METRATYDPFIRVSGILNDKQIAHLVDKSEMIQPYYDHKVRVADKGRVISYGQNSYGYDVTLSNDFISYTGHSVIDPKDPASFNGVRFEVGGAHYDLGPNEAILARTVEYVRMPPNVTGIILGKSTYCRCNLLVNATPLEAGWEGDITLELRNLGPRPIRLYINEGIAQILFFRGKQDPETTYVGAYQNQKGVTLPFNVG